MAAWRSGAAAAADIGFPEEASQDAPRYVQSERVATANSRRDRRACRAKGATCA